MKPINDLSQTAIEALLPTKLYHVTVEGTLPSTNTALKEAALRGAPHGEVLIADCQTAGRGRLGRAFFSPSGSGVYMSILLRPSLPLSVAAGRITTLAALAVSRAITQTSGIETSIKWVNDLLIQGKKVCGILAEAVSMGEENPMILGIGINVKSTAFPTELAGIATSLEEHGNAPDRNLLIAAILDELASLDPARPQDWMPEYKKRSAVLGNTVTVLPFGGEAYEATAVDVTDDGALLVERDGKIDTIFSGEVSLRLANKEFSK